MPLAVGTIVQVVFRGDIWSQRYMLTHTYRILETTSTGNTTDDANSIALHFTDTTAGSFLSAYRACLAMNYTIREISAQAIHPIRHVRAPVQVVYGGTASQVATTGNIAGVITLRTQLSGRTQIANKHIGPMPTNGYDAGQIVSGHFNNMVTLGGRFAVNQLVPATGAGIITLVPVIFHREFGQHDVVFSGIPSDRVGTMRRRTLRVGE